MVSNIGGKGRDLNFKSQKKFGVCQQIHSVQNYIRKPHGQKKTLEWLERSECKLQKKRGGGIISGVRGCHAPKRLWSLVQFSALKCFWGLSSSYCFSPFKKYRIIFNDRCLKNLRVFGL